MVDWFFNFYKRSKMPEKIVIIIVCVFIVGLLLYIGSNGIRSFN